MRSWVMDNPLSKRWPLYTRGNVGEVFPEVVLPFSWDLLGQAAEDGWRDGFQRLGIVADGDFAADEPMVILGVFGGYCYINASYVRMLGVRTPGASVDQIDLQFFGESDAPAYEPRTGGSQPAGDAAPRAHARPLLRAKDLAVLDEDRARVDEWVARQPGPEASERAADGVLPRLRAAVPPAVRAPRRVHVRRRARAPARCSTCARSPVIRTSSSACSPASAGSTRRRRRARCGRWRGGRRRARP